MVPLVGLGTDQVEKAYLEEHDIDMDEHKQDDERMLMQRLSTATLAELKYKRIMVFLSPDTIIDPKWVPIWEMLARRGLIAYFCIDEAHEVEQSGRSFCTVFQDAVKMIANLVKMMPRPAPRIIMSATLTQDGWRNTSRLASCIIGLSSLKHAPEKFSKGGVVKT